MAVYVSNITIPTGSDFEQTFTIETVNNTPLDLTVYTGAASLKKHPASLTITAAFQVSFPDRANGKVKISLGSSITSSIRPGRYSYDLILNDGSKISRVIEGSAIVTPGVTISGVSTGGSGSPVIIGGSQGIQGRQGIQGNFGPQGIQGTDGAFAGQGIQGGQGVQGAQGMDGGFVSQGIQGIQGGQGTQGAQGLQGWYGIQGTQGAQGIQGTQGAQGSQGIQGTQGIQGVQGILGYQGTQGIQGTQGSQGIQGTDGAFAGQGIQGIQGQQGLADNYWILGAAGIHTSSKVGIGTTISNSELNVLGNVEISGIVTANTFNGDVSTAHKTFYISNSGSFSYTFSSSGVGFTESKQNPTLYLTRGQKYEFEIDASGHPFWIKTIKGIGNSNSYNYGIVNNGSQSGVVTFTIPFDAPSILYYQCQYHSDMNGTININGAPSRTLVTSSTGNLGAGDTANIQITGFKSYLLQKIETSAASWITIYVDETSRTNDNTRNENTTPLPGSGVVGEFISTTAKTQLFTPGTIGFNNDNPTSSTIYTKVVNKTGVSTDISITLTILQLES